MIHGKFFAGLPPKMMDRSIGPNRQESKFYWPDESDAESASELRSKRKNRITQQTSIESNSSNSTEIEPKELFKKQLTSKIEFYDMIDDKNHTSPPSKSDGKQKKMEAFSSKIEFYDYADDMSTIHIPKTDKNSKKDLERNSKNSPKTIDKRIKFVEDMPVETGIPPPKGILRNNETPAKEKPVQEQSRKKLMKKRNLSKSVENLSTKLRDFSDDEDDCIKVIANDVKNVKINDHKIQEVREEVDDRRSRQNFMIDKGQRRRCDHFEDDWDSPEQIDENFFRKGGRNKSHVIYHEIRHDSCDNDESQIRPKLEKSEDHEFSFTSPPPTKETTTLNNDNWRKSEKSTKNQNSLPQAKHQKPVQPSLDQPDQSVGNRVQRHLVSSIRFGNDNEVTTDRPQKTARGSAVMRVSVGLPD